MKNVRYFEDVYWPKYTVKEAEKIKKKLLSNKTNYLFGNEGNLLEKEFSKKVNCKYGIAVSNGTLALELGLRSLKLKKNDEVIVTCRSFIASASAIKNIGAKVVFTDIDIDTQNISIDTIKKSLTKKTKAILCVHFAGLPCNMIDIVKLAKKKKIKLIEDCSQAHGAKINKSSVGSFGDVAAWSFCQDKIISTGGEGGMVTTNSKKIYKFIWSYKDHGKNQLKYFKKSNNSYFKYIHENEGSNYRLTEIQSLLGRIHTKKLDSYCKKRNKVSNTIINGLKKYKVLQFQKIPINFTHAYYKLYITLNTEFLKTNINNKYFLDYLKKNNIPSSQGTCPEIYLEKSFKKESNKITTRFKNAKYLGEYSFAINITNLYTIKDCKYIVSKISNLCKIISIN